MGAIIGGAIGATGYVLIKRKNFLWAADIITSVLLLGQAIGRWGNFANGELYGAEITSKAWQWFPFAVKIYDGNGDFLGWFQALFFYESVLSIIGLIALIIIYLKTKKVGIVTGLYFVYYGVVRLCLEGLRQSEYILKWGSVQVSSLMSGIFIAIGAGILIYLLISHFMAQKGAKNAE